MPAMVLVLLAFFLVIVCFAIGFMVLRHTQNKKQQALEARIQSLEHDLTTANTLVGNEVNQLKSVQSTNEYEKYAGLVLAQMDRAVIVINQNRTISLINAYAKQYLDLAAAPGMPYKDVIHTRDGQANDYGPFEAAFEGHAQRLPDNIELTSQRGTIPISGTILPLMTGTTVGAIVFIFEDNSTQVARVKEEQAFFSAAAHELRTPLTVIRMTVALLKDKFETMPKEKIAEHLRRTDETTERLVRLVNDFLNISRIDQGRLEIKTEKFDMVTLTDEVIGNLSLLAKERNLYVHHEVNVSERMVTADRAKSAEVLANLISNSLKYTIQGGVTITHSITGSTFTTTVTDTGMGIQQQSQSLLFKRFGQIGQARQEQGTKSTGLGLYISKKFAQLMKGDVQLVKSEPGSGSTFAFILPLG